MRIFLKNKNKIKNKKIRVYSTFVSEAELQNAL